MTPMPWWLVGLLSAGAAAGPLSAWRGGSTGVILAVFFSFCVLSLALAWWVYRDSTAAGAPDAFWAAGTLILWPVSVPLRLFRARRSEGIVAALAVAAVFGLMLTSFGTVIIRELVLAGRYAKAGDAALKAARGGEKDRAAEAVAQYRKSLEMYEGEFPLYPRLAEAALLAGDRAAAEKYFSRLRRETGEKSGAKRLTGEIAILHYGMRLCVADQKAAIMAAMVPDLAGLRKGLSDFLAHHEAVALAANDGMLAYKSLEGRKKQELGAELQSAAANASELKLDEFQAFAAAMARLLQSSPDAEAAYAAFLRAGRANLNKEPPARREPHLREAVRLYPRFPDAYLALAAAYLELGDNERLAWAARQTLGTLAGADAMPSMGAPARQEGQARAYLGTALVREARVRLKDRSARKRKAAKGFLDGARAELAKARALAPDDKVVKGLAAELAR